MIARIACAICRVMAGGDAIEWRVADGLVGYADAVAEMEARAAAIRDEGAPELVWLVEHPPLYTAGTSAVASELVVPDRFPVHRAGRGGRYTYHGPGQRVGYVMLDLDRRGRDIRRYVHALERWVIGALAGFGIAAHSTSDRIGIWTVAGDGREAKIGAIGVRVRRWVTFHGFAVNVAPDLAHFDGIVPCGLPGYPVTSMAAQGTRATLRQFDDELKNGFRAFLSDLSGPAAA